MLPLLLFKSYICFWNEELYATFVPWGKITFVSLFAFIVEIVTKVSNNETVWFLKKYTNKQINLLWYMTQRTIGGDRVNRMTWNIGNRFRNDYTHCTIFIFLLKLRLHLPASPSSEVQPIHSQWPGLQRHRWIWMEISWDMTSYIQMSITPFVTILLKCMWRIPISWQNILSTTYRNRTLIKLRYMYICKHNYSFINFSCSNIAGKTRLSWKFTRVSFIKGKPKMIPNCTYSYESK